LNDLIAPRSTDGSVSKPFNHGQMAGFDKGGRLRADDEMAGSESEPTASECGIWLGGLISYAKPVAADKNDTGR
jgi:hypothetical protein